MWIKADDGFHVRGHQHLVWLKWSQAVQIHSNGHTGKLRYIEISKIFETWAILERKKENTQKFIDVSIDLPDRIK